MTNRISNSPDLLLSLPDRSTADAAVRDTHQQRVDRASGRTPVNIPPGSSRVTTSTGAGDSMLTPLPAAPESKNTTALLAQMTLSQARMSEYQNALPAASEVLKEGIAKYFTDKGKSATLTNDFGADWPSNLSVVHSQKNENGARVRDKWTPLTELPWTVGGVSRDPHDFSIAHVDGGVLTEHPYLNSLQVKDAIARNLERGRARYRECSVGNT